MSEEPQKPQQGTKSQDKLPLHEKALYGTGATALGTTQNIVDHQIQQVLVFGMGMSPITKSIIVMIFRVWDALIDPVMGWISDNTRTRWGRRRPYMFVGCIIMAILMPIVWRFSEDWDMKWIAVWFTIGGILLSTATTIFNLPYQALKQELTPDYDERTSLNMYISFVLRIFAMFTPWIWTLTQQPFFTGQEAGEEPNTLWGIRNLSIVCAFAVIVLGMIPTFVCKERYYSVAAKQKKEPFFKSVKLTLRSKSFLMINAFVFLLSMEGLVLGMGGYLTTYYVWGGDLVKAATFGGIGGTTAAILGFLTLPAFRYLATRWGKDKALLLVFGGQILLAISTLFVYNPNYPWAAIVPWMLSGILMTGFWMVVPAMNADVIDEDELKYGERREGSFESVFWLLYKFAGTVFMGISGFIVVIVGFDIDLKADQAEGVFQNIIWLMFLIPFIFSILEFIIIWKWPLTRERMEEIRAELEKRRGAINPAA